MLLHPVVAAVVGDLAGLINRDPDAVRARDPVLKVSVFTDPTRYGGARGHRVVVATNPQKALALGETLTMFRIVRLLTRHFAASDT